MYNRAFAGGFVDLRELLDDAWIDFEATSPVGIDLIGGISAEHDSYSSHAGREGGRD
jgi:hypothetical protein